MEDTHEKSLVIIIKDSVMGGQNCEILSALEIIKFSMQLDMQTT